MALKFKAPQTDIEDDILVEGELRVLLAREAGGKPIETDNLPWGRIYIRTKPPATVFLILQRPTMESLRALDRIRSSLTSAPPTVVIAPPLSSELKRQLLERGIYSYLEKPILAGQLENLVRDLAKDEHAERAGGYRE